MRGPTVLGHQADASEKRLGHVVDQHAPMPRALRWICLSVGVTPRIAHAPVTVVCVARGVCVDFRLAPAVGTWESGWSVSPAAEMSNTAAVQYPSSAM